jgi:hypothetical protein
MSNTFSVTQISSTYHDFVENSIGFDVEDEDDAFVRKKKRPKGKALLLATVQIDESKKSNLQKQIGLEEEDDMLNMYEKLTGLNVTDRNEKLYELMIDDVKVIGKIDGMEREKGLIVEHKRRLHGLLFKVPDHEKVQCHFYMKMTNMNKCHLVETFGTHMKIHEFNFDEEFWNQILVRVRLSNFI